MPVVLWWCFAALLCLTPGEVQATTKPDKPAASGTSAPSARPSTPKRNQQPAEPSDKAANLWTLNPNEMKTPQDSLVGRLNGETFRPEKITFENGILKFAADSNSLPDQQIVVFLFRDVKDLLSKPLVISPGPNPGGPVPDVHVHFKRGRTGGRDSLSYVHKYAMKLEMKKNPDGRIQGMIHLCLPDDTRSFLAGRFTVESKDTPPAANEIGKATDPISGTFRGKWPAKRFFASLTVMGVDTSGKSLGGGSLGIDVVPEENSIASSGDMELVFTKGSTPKYRFSPTATGAYFVVLSVDRVPVAWKWIGWENGSRGEVDLDISSKGFGSLDVRWSISAGRDVRVLPLEEKGELPKAVGDGAEFVKRYSRSLQGWIAPVTAGARSVNFPKLRAGRYRVFVGSLFKDVEVQPGQTAKVEVK